MSRTIAHTPWQFATHIGVVQSTTHHDHCKGVCQVETIDDVRQRYGPKLPHYQRGTMAIWQIPCRPEVPKRAWHKLERVHPPKEYVRSGFTKPARQKARRDLRQAMREHNTYGETDTQPEPYRTRHGAIWAWY